MDDFEQFGEDANSPNENLSGEHKLIQVVTNPKKQEPVQSETQHVSEKKDSPKNTEVKNS